MPHQDECAAIADLTALLIVHGPAAMASALVLGCSVQLSEAETHWRSFFQSLVDRRMRDITLVVSDDHAGLKAARHAVLTAAPWQRCQFHLVQNAMARAPKIAMRTNIAGDLRHVFDAACVEAPCS
jgi:putative transposase